MGFAQPGTHPPRGDTEDNTDCSTFTRGPTVFECPLKAALGVSTLDQ